jgi:mRNA-degrading endonuclease RelE of RelBE toxin-antitoxin system
VVHRIEFTREARRHFAQLDAHRQAALRDSLLRQLAHEPAVETRHRRRLRPNALATWRLRAGELRVYYDVAVALPVVVIKAIGIKRRNRVVIGGEEIDLS